MEPIRVLQVSYDMNMGGAETLIMNIYRNINRDLVQFDFLLHSPDISAYEEEISLLGGRIFRIPRFLGYNKFSYDRKLKGFLMAHPEYRIVHDHLMDSATETLRIAKRLGRFAVAHSHIADIPFSAGELIRRFFRRNLWRISDHRFACSKAAGLWLYKGKADFQILNNGIDTRRFAFDRALRTKVREELGIHEKTKLIGTVGRMEVQKNQLRLLDIFRRTLELEPDCVLVIVGAGSLENEIKAKIQSLGMERNVILTGPRNDVNELMMGFDSFVLPSLYEGLGIVLVEAQATGLPCVFTDSIPDDVDLIPNLVNRISLEQEDMLWAEKITESFNSAARREDAWTQVKDRGYDIKSSAKLLQDFYLEKGRIDNE